MNSTHFVCVCVCASQTQRITLIVSLPSFSSLKNMVIIEQKRKADPVIIHTRQGAILPNIKIFSSSNILIFGCS